ncbi:MAG TPA: LytTR family DNA-binding domain-containing protein [Bacteroidia bacterium]|nr:LytTR family DNA-binding domain-containing protein [Bacteroidia bacterium]
MKAIILDDEPDARDALRMAVERYCPEIKIIASCENPEEGLEQIKKHNPDLLFLDVDMPGMSGFDVLNQLAESDMNVIFVTAHDKYAIKAIRFSALDYLLKPVDADELQRAVKRAMEKQNRSENNIKVKSFLDNIRSQQERLGKLSVPTMEGLLFMDIHEIVYCKADDNYTEIILSSKEKIVISKTLKDVEEMLEGYTFFRIHQSYLINLKFMQRYVKGYGGYVVMKDGASLDVARRKKEEFLLRIRGI